MKKLKHLMKQDKQNSGFSLVEVLVTMLVIAIISVPLLKTFVFTANVNQKSRRLSNATSTAQDVAEYFNAASLEALKLNYASEVTTLSNGALVFKNIGDGIHSEDGVPYYEGQEGEHFYITVILDPSDFTGNDESAVGHVNEYIAPNISNINGTNSQTVFKQFTRYDGMVINNLKTKYNSALGGKTIDKSQIVKSSVITVSETKNGEKVDYSYNLTVKYTYVPDTRKYVSYDFVIGEGTIDASTGYAPNLYMVYGAFDVYGSSYSPFARDTIDVKYMSGHSEASSWEKPVNAYLIQQNVYYGNNKSNVVSIVPDNVNISCYDGGAVSGRNYDNTAGNFHMYSNIEGWADDAGLTVGTETMTTLYTMNVYVRYDESDTTDYTHIEDGTIELSDYFTSFSTVKEE